MNQLSLGNRVRAIATHGSSLSRHCPDDFKPDSLRTRVHIIPICIFVNEPIECIMTIVANRND